MRRLVLGTAGHVDHGKTTLVRALTGVDTDRLPEEKRRGISIELGFAPLYLRPDLMAGVVDVPGHERFVRTMIHGATGMDLLLLVIAADEGIRPQTREHLDICRLLGVERAVCALTKTDLVSPDRVAERQVEIGDFLDSFGFASSPILPVNATNGEGLTPLRNALIASAQTLPVSAGDECLFLPVDRVFTKQGFGTVVTGTLSGAPMNVNDTLVALPEGAELTVRGIEVFGQPVPSVEPRTRVAINLAGPDRSAIRRGQTLVRPGEVTATKKLHVEFFEPKEEFRRPTQKELSHIRALAGTQDAAGRLILMNPESESKRYGELRLVTPIAVRARDRIILRTETPTRTIGGGVVLDPRPLLSLRKAELSQIVGAAPSQRLTHWIDQAPLRLPCTTGSLAQRISFPVESARRQLSRLADRHEIRSIREACWIAQESFDELRTKLKEEIDRRQEMSAAQLLSNFLPLASKRVLQEVIDDLVSSGEILRTPTKLQSNTREPTKAHPALDRLESAGLSPPTVSELAAAFGESDSKIRSLLVKAEQLKRAVRLADDLYCARGPIDKIIPKLGIHFSTQPTLAIGHWKALVGVSRKFAVPLLEYFDRERFTICRPDRLRIPGPRLLEKAETQNETIFSSSLSSRSRIADSRPDTSLKRNANTT
ncbi:MAG TPA: selenocysteine-specific translation elongation factor [Bdellovibrionota bacterium]|nr:selenocysteine-specific translation elongation factor [Bdellovibrionota bacterium]